MPATTHARSSGEVIANHAPLVGPRVFAVRGPSRSGKTALCQRLVRTLSSEGLRVAWVKRTHHAVDTPGKASDRIWSAGPAVSALRADDRLVLTQAPGSPEPEAMLAQLPADLDLVLVETHEPVDYPTVLSSRLHPEPGEHVIGRWELFSEDAALDGIIAPIRASLPQDRELDLALRRAIQLHGGHGCAGLILGARLALAGSRALGIAVPDTRKRLIVVAETDRCAVDGIQAVTGCRPGKRTLRILDYGKLAATFFDEHTGAAVRIAAGGDLRERVGANGEDRHQVQRRVYATWPVEDLFTMAQVQFELSQFDRPGPPRSRVLCVSCGEEVSDARHVETEMGPRCRPCVNQPEFASKGASS